MSDDAEYMPELGQLCFGQPFQTHAVSEIFEAALFRINTEIQRVAWNVYQINDDGPMFGGREFKCSAFHAVPYSWNEDEAQEYNFRWRDVKVSWYKRCGRGTSANRNVTPCEVSDMLDECLKVLRQMDAENSHGFTKDEVLK